MVEKTKSSNGLEIGSCVALGFLLLGGIIYWLLEDKALKNCENKESPLCLTGSCPATTDTCLNKPFKVNSDGSLTCKNSIVSNQSNVPNINSP
jgi:hypothetical protein